MADKQISQLVAASTVNNDDLFVMQQGGTAKKLSGEKLGDYVYRAAAEKIEEVNEAVAEAQAAVDELILDKDAIAQSVASMAQLGTDTTLTTPGMAADAKATGDKIKDLESEYEAHLEQETATPGVMVTFEDGAENVPLKSLKVNVDPIQNLNGYDYPWPAGGGKNLLDTSKMYQESGKSVALGQNEAHSTRPYSLKAGTYTIKVNSSISAFIYLCTSSAPSGTSLGNTTAARSFTLENDDDVSLYVYKSGDGITINDISSFQLEAGSIATEWVPYSNVCPITGRVEVNAIRSGKNLLSLVEAHSFGGITQTVESDGGITLVGTTTSAISQNFYIFYLPAGNYVFSALGSTITATGGTVSIYLRDIDNNSTLAMIASSTISTEYSFALAKGTNIRFYCIVSASTTVSGTFYVLLRKSGTDSTYEPPKAETYEIAFPSGAGTVYGGILDAASKKLTVTSAKITLDGTQAIKVVNWRPTATSIGWYYSDLVVPCKIAGSNAETLAGLYSNKLQTASYSEVYYGSVGDNLVAGTSSAGNGLYIRVGDPSLTTKTLVNDWLTSNPIDVVYPLASPITYNLTAEQVKTLLGLNNIWADSGNISECIYYKMPDEDGTKKTVESIIAGTEKTMVASQNYTVDSLVIAMDKMYKVTSAIASGETIIPGTNCSPTTVEAELALRVPADRTVNGIALSSDIAITPNDITFNSNQTYDSGTLGAEISDLSTAVSDILQTNILYDEATKVVSGNTTYVYEDILTLTDVHENEIYTLTIGSVTGNLSTTVAYVRSYDENNTRKRQIALATNTSLTNSITIAADEDKLIFVLYPSAVGATTATYTNVKIYKGTTPYKQINPDLLKSDDVAEVIGDVASEKANETIEELLDYSVADRFDPDDAVIGKYISPSTGAESGNASYFSTDFMEIRDGETLYFYNQGTMTAKQARYYACYDSGKVRVTGGENVTSIAQSGTAAFVRASFSYNNSYFNSSPEGLSVLATSKPIFLPWTKTNPVYSNTYLPRKTVYIYGDDTEAQVIEKLVNAYKTGNCDVYFERANYAFGTVLPNIKTLYGLNEREIPVGNNCRYYFNGATLEATIDLSTLGENFYCNLFGSQRFPSSFEMYDGVLKATDTRYVVHDEASAYKATYRRVYRNMQMQYTTNASTDSYRKCIGGGTGLSGVIDIEGCKFITDGSEVAVSYHGNGNSTSNAEFSLNVRNCYFSNGIRAGELSTNQTARLFYVGNSSTIAPQTYTGWTVTSFLNEIRT